MLQYKRLEKEYAEFTGSAYSVSCNSGTSALHLALLSAGVGEGDEVILPDFTMAACGFAVHYTGAVPVFVDSRFDNPNIDVTKIEEKITPKTKAIMAVHIYGRLCDMDRIREIADKHNLVVIEDAAEAQGAVYNSVADITCYSFYRNKIIHAEEGGICTTNKKKYADKMNYLKNMAFPPEHNYFHEEIGFNYRIPEAMAKMARKSLKKVKKNLKKREKMSHKVFDNMPKRDVVWVHDLNCGLYRDTIMKLLNNHGIETRYFFQPLSTFPMWKQDTGMHAKFWSQKGLYLPNFMKLTRKQRKIIEKTIDRDWER